jgi:uncharacterized tellurite resistance protein B-like protein
MARKKSGGQGVVVLVGIFLFLLATVPKSVWIGFAVVAVIWLIFRAFKSDGPATLERDQRANSPSDSATHPLTFASQRNDGEETFLRVPSSEIGSSGFNVPNAPFARDEGKWYPAGASVEVRGVTIPSGMVYVGVHLKTRHSENDPALIDPTKSIASTGDYSIRQTDYWPSYSQISPSARRSYLNWLSEGKKDPRADIGFVFLYFYGLERRVLVDAPNDSVARAELPAIAKELERLLQIYGGTSGSFKNYATGLLEWIELTTFSSGLYKQPIPEFIRTWEIPTYIKLALGQAALVGDGVPANLALAWLRLDPNTRLRTPALRCADEFAKLFKVKYQEKFGDGIKLPKNKTKLKLTYSPASSAFRGFGEIKLSFGEMPDVTVLTGPIGELKKIAESATTELEPYSRFLGRAKGQEVVGSLEGLLQLPFTLWPAPQQTALLDLRRRTEVVGMITTHTFGDLLSPFVGGVNLSRNKILELAKLMESLGIAMEPDVLGGAASPKLDDRIILFSTADGTSDHRASPAYQAALLTLQLASSVASADGEFGDSEVVHLQSQVRSWTHLTKGHQQRLLAHLILLAAVPVPLQSLKKRLDPLPVASKEAIAAFMATVAQADGTVSPTEVKTLERVYKVLGVDSKRVFSDVHAAASGSNFVPSPSAGVGSEFKLDQARIAALQQDTEKVSKLLAGIFIEEEPAGEAIATESAAELPSGDTEPETGLWGLDFAHSSFARTLLSRASWSRQELLDIAEDLDLMLDGALERINEASFDQNDMSLTEGDDPIEVSAEVLEKIAA